MIKFVFRLVTLATVVLFGLQLTAQFNCLALAFLTLLELDFKRF